MANITATRDSKWHIQKGTEQVLVEFVKGQELEIGKDVPADIAADMVKHGYAVAPEAAAPAPEEKGEEEKAINPAKKNKAMNPAKQNK